MSWTSTPNIVLEKKQSSSREPASIKNHYAFNRSVKSETLDVICGENLKVETPYKQIRLRFKNCQKEPFVQNKSNYFQASLWQNLNEWKSDYIPLEKSKNLIAYKDPTSNQSHQIEIIRK